MTSDTVVIHARVDSDTNARATEVLEAMGLSVSDAIRLLLWRIADEERLPFAQNANPLSETEFIESRRSDSPPKES